MMGLLQKQCLHKFSEKIHARTHKVANVYRLQFYTTFPSHLRDVSDFAGLWGEMRHYIIYFAVTTAKKTDLAPSTTVYIDIVFARFFIFAFKYSDGTSVL